ncbi:MAG: ribonuclease P protein component [Chloroflexi bacterium]|nr:ribonuclease P protein component [Chloroflexota bacterium]MBU1661369.1 ribonuclease P protein component [Chloroflexota bacterium]
MKRKFRLTRSTDFKRVRRFGKSYAHPLIVLISQPNELHTPRFGVAAGRSVGNAVRRNRAKRQIRETIRPLIPTIQSGWDIILLARKPIAAATYSEIEAAIYSLLRRASLLKDINVN